MSFVSFSAASVVKPDVPQVLLPLPTPLRPSLVPTATAAMSQGMHSLAYVASLSRNAVRGWRLATRH